MLDRHSGVAALGALMGVVGAWLLVGGSFDTGPALPEAPVARRLVAVEHMVAEPGLARRALVAAQPTVGLAADPPVIELSDDAIFCDLQGVATPPEDGTPVRLEPMMFPDSVRLQGQVAHGGLWIESSVRRGMGRVHLDGFLPASLDWWDDTCGPLKLERSVGVVEGEVLDSDGWPVPGAWVNCPAMRTAADSDGRFSCELSSGSVVLRARRQSGQLTVLSEPVTLLGHGEHSGVVLRLPAGPLGGIGAVLLTATEGVLLGTVLPGYPAQQAGLRSGDLLLELDGESLTGVPSEEVVRRVVGTLGTELELRVRSAEGSERRVVLTRSAVGSRNNPAAID